MKNLQRLCMAGVFTLMLTTATFAGDIATPGKTQPPPTLPYESSEVVGGDIHTGTPSEAIETVADFAMGLFQTMLSVF